jgi:hypothetical protein
MPRLSMVILCLALLTLMINANAEVQKNVPPGKADLDLGNGYKASFELPGAENAYDLEVIEPTQLDFLVKGTRYEFYVYPAGKEDPITKLFLYVYSAPWRDPIPKYDRMDPTGSDIGPQVRMPQTIDGARGYVGYDWLADDPGTDPSKAMWMFFTYYPHAWEEDGSLMSNIVIKGESAYVKDYPNSLQVIQSIVDSIHITGPGI